MDYIFISLLMGLGVWFHIMQRVSSVRKRYAKLKFKDVWATFLDEEWDSLFVSALVCFSCVLALKIIRYNEVVMPDWFENWGMYVLVLVLGYAGQRLAYKYLGTAEKVLAEKANTMYKGCEHEPKH
jgi:hypothetical protein